jgi:hypothetical protein
MTKHQRDTYISGREILERAISYLTQVRDILEQAREQTESERVRLLVNSVETEQRNVLGAIERYLEDVPDKVLVTWVQYTVELPSDVEPPEQQPLTTLGITRWLIEVNGRLQTLFKELAEKGDKADSDVQMREVYGSIAQLLESHERRLSKEYQRFEDL